MMALDFNDFYWQLTPSADELVDQSSEDSSAAVVPEAHAPSNLLLERLRHAAETQESVTIEGAELIDYKPFLGDVLPHGLKDLERLSVTFSVSPLGPVVNSILRIRGVDTELRNIALGLYVLPGQRDRWRLTNRQDDDAPVVVSVDFTWQPSNAPGNVIFLMPGVSMTIEARPVAGRTVRDMIALYAFLRALHEPRVLEFVDSRTNETRFVAHGVRISDLNPDEELLCDALTTIQQAFPTETFPMPDSLGQDDVRKIFEVAEIVHSGLATVAAESLSSEMPAETLSNLLEYGDESGVLQSQDSRGVLHDQGLNIRQEHTLHIVFGVSLDLGPSRATFPAMRFSESVEELRTQVSQLAPETIVSVMLLPADPRENRVHYYYPRFRLHALTELRDYGDRSLTETERNELDDLISITKRQIIDDGISGIAQRQQAPSETVRQEVMEAVQRSIEEWTKMKSDPDFGPKSVREVRSRRRRQGR